MIHGCRPTSATTHPASFAMYGNGIISIRTQSSQRACQSPPQHQQQNRRSSNRNKNGAQTDHDAIRVVRDLDRRPKVAPVGVETSHIGLEISIGKKTQEAGHEDWVDQTAAGDVGHPDDGQRRAARRSKESLHRGELDGLSGGDVPAIAVTGRKDRQRCKDQARDRARPRKSPSNRLVAARQHEVRADPRNEKGSRKQRPHQDVHELPAEEWRRQDRPDVIEKNRAVRRDAVTDRVLHPRLGGDDEEPRKPRSGANEHRRPSDERAMAFRARR